MMNILGAVALSYLAGSGTITNSMVVGRGLFRAACKAVSGDLHAASAEALASLAAPALMSYGATASLVLDALDSAHELVGPAMEAAGQALPHRHAA